MLTLIERTKTEKLYALRAIEEHLRVQLMNVRAEIRELELEPTKQSAPVTTPTPTPEQQPAVMPDESTSETIKVVWETESSGYTIDNTETKRPFQFLGDKFDQLEQPEITLLTSKGSVISSNWKSVKISNNKHFAAIKADQTRHLIELCSLRGFDLKEIPSMGDTARFEVYKCGVKLGNIGSGFSLWYVGWRSVNTYTNYGRVWEALAALEKQFNEGQKAKVEIGL